MINCVFWSYDDNRIHVLKIIVQGELIIPCLGPYWLNLALKRTRALKLLSHSECGDSISTTSCAQRRSFITQS
jgi:hypothetical protein